MTRINFIYCTDSILDCNDEDKLIATRECLALDENMLDQERKPRRAPTPAKGMDSEKQTPSKAGWDSPN